MIHPPSHDTVGTHSAQHFAVPVLIRLEGDVPEFDPIYNLVLAGGLWPENGCKNQSTKFQLIFLHPAALCTTNIVSVPSACDINTEF